MFEILFAHRQDAYPALPEYRSKMRWLTRPEASLFRFLYTLGSVRQYMDKVNAGSREDFGEIYSRLQGELVTSALPLHRKWRAMQDEVLAILRASVGSKRVFFFTEKTIHKVHEISAARGIKHWVEANQSRFFSRGRKLVSASERAIRKERLRVHRTELKTGDQAVVESSFHEDWNTLKVLSVRKDGRMTLSGDHAAKFVLRQSSPKEIPYGEWQITRGRLKGRIIRKLLPLDYEMYCARLGLLTTEGDVKGATPSRVVDAGFQTKNAEAFEYSSRVRSGSLKIADIVRAVLPRATYATLPVYLIRRLGYPQCGTDDGKDLMGGWRLTTPEPGLVLSVTPNASSIEYGFGYGFSPAAAIELEKATDAWWVHWRTRSTDAEALRPHLAVIARYHRAARIAVADLVRPVEVRSQLINAEGIVKDGDAKITPEGVEVDVAEYSQACNYGVDDSLFENHDASCDLLNAASAFGPTPGEAYAMAAKVLKRNMRKS